MSPNRPIVYLSGPRPGPGEAGPAPDAAPAGRTVAAAAVVTAATATSAVVRRRPPSVRKVMPRLPWSFPGLRGCRALRSVSHTCVHRSNRLEAVPLKGGDEYETAVNEPTCSRRI